MRSAWARIRSRSATSTLTPRRAAHPVAVCRRGSGRVAGFEDGAVHLESGQVGQPVPPQDDPALSGARLACGSASGGSDSLSTASRARSARACAPLGSRFRLRRLGRAEGLLELGEAVGRLAPEILAERLDLLREVLRAAGFLIGEDGNSQSHERDQEGELRHSLGCLSS